MNWNARYSTTKKQEKAIQQAQQEAIANKTENNDSTNDDVTSPDVY
jgi:hypothetical protein